MRADQDQQKRVKLQRSLSVAVSASVWRPVIGQRFLACQSRPRTSWSRPVVLPGRDDAAAMWEE